MLQNEKFAGGRVYPRIAGTLLATCVLLRFADILNPAILFLRIVGSILGEFAFRFRNKGKPGPTVELFTGTANTALGTVSLWTAIYYCPEFHDRRLLALVENDVPVHVTVPDLTTVGVYTFQGQLNHMFTGAFRTITPVTYSCSAPQGGSRHGRDVLLWL